MTLKDVQWRYFNILTFGINEEELNDAAQFKCLTNAIARCENLMMAAMQYVKAYDNDHKKEPSRWAENLGLFVHVYPRDGFILCFF